MVICCLVSLLVCLLLVGLLALLVCLYCDFNVLCRLGSSISVRWYGLFVCWLCCGFWLRCLASCLFVTWFYCGFVVVCLLVTYILLLLFFYICGGFVYMMVLFLLLWCYNVWSCVAVLFWFTSCFVVTRRLFAGVFCFGGLLLRFDWMLAINSVVLAGNDLLHVVLICVFYGLFMWYCWWLFARLNLGYSAVWLCSMFIWCLFDLGLFGLFVWLFVDWWMLRLCFGSVSWLLV